MYFNEDVQCGHVKPTFVFTFIHRVNGVVKTEVEKYVCWNWTEASGHFHKRLRELGIKGESISACYFQEEGQQAASAFGGANIEL